MKLTGKQYRAIGTYAKKHSLRLALSTPPYISFIDTNGELKSEYLDRIVTHYEQELKDAARGRSDIKKAMERNNV